MRDNGIIFLSENFKNLSNLRELHFNCIILILRLLYK